MFGFFNYELNISSCFYVNLYFIKLIFFNCILDSCYENIGLYF